jgi:hypothetical protein
MKLLKLSALILSVVAFSATAQGAISTGMDLKRVCAKPEPESAFAGTQANVSAYANSQYCYGYIAGYFDFGAMRSDFPVPSGVTAEQFRLVLLRYMNGHPQELHLDASEVLMRAAYDAWKK